MGGSTQLPGDDSALSVRECWELLRGEEYGRLAVTAADGPDVYPINAFVDHATLVFRTAEGAKLDAIRSDHRIAFEVDGYDADRHTAWSVVIRGTADEVTERLESVDAVELGVTPWQHGPKPAFIRLTPHSVTGRRFRRVDRGEWQIDDVQQRPSPDE
jgi:nitroimidazol reductase NimA-like FMN-containing flavoprotein (pyridoxamine 5'-phosphate oxidase superfamily)